MHAPISKIDLSSTHIVEGDVQTELARVADEAVQLCITSPPYNIGKSYERGSFTSFAEYRDWMEGILETIFVKLRPGGSLCLQVGNHVSDGRVEPLDYAFMPILSRIGFVLRNRIIWTFNFGLHAQRRLSGRYETLLWLTKGDDYKFNLDPIRVRQIYPGKRHAATKGDKAGSPSGNPRGKNPSDVWSFDPKEAFFGQSPGEDDSSVPVP
jgi:adenine-specific DNA-methyltransferase